VAGLPPIRSSTPVQSEDEDEDEDEEPDKHDRTWRPTGDEAEDDDDSYVEAIG
jgi:hypothetical protein